MYKHSFDFGSTPIEIIAEERIKKNILDEIFKLIQFVRFDFNYKVHHSSAYELNDAAVDSPVKLSTEFIHYLKINITKTLFSEGQFNPFRAEENIEEAILVEGNQVIKKSPAFFDSTVLMLAFTLDQIAETLIANKLETFLISTRDLHFGFGDKSWEVKFEVEDEFEYEVELTNEAAGLDFNKNYLTQKPQSRDKFGIKDSEMIMKYCIFKTANAVTFKVISKILEKMTYKSDFQEFSTLNKIPVHIIDKDDNEVTIKPYLNWE